MIKDIPRGQTSPTGFKGVAAALWRRRNRVLAPTALAAVVLAAAVNTVTPQYKSEARILVEARPNPFLRLDADRAVENAPIGTQAMQSQVQLVMSRDLALDVIARLKLNERPEFSRRSLPSRLLERVGLRSEQHLQLRNERSLQVFLDRLSAYALTESHVLTIEFRSEDPDLAAAVANTVADRYLELERAARRDQALAAGDWLLHKIDQLRPEVAAAELRAQALRNGSNFAFDQRNTTLSGQQLSQLTSNYSAARAAKMAAETRARTLRETLKSGGPVQLSTALDSRVIRGLMEQRARLHAYLAQQSSTLLDQHPRILQLRAQLAEIEAQLRQEAMHVMGRFEHEAELAAVRVASLEASLAGVKSDTSAATPRDLELRAAEREARAQRDLLESYLAKYGEATVRNTLASSPAEGGVMSRAVSSHMSAFPKKTPIVLSGTLVIFMLSFGIVAAGLLMNVGSQAADGQRLRTSERAAMS
jgi:succinoglycan biosynthesis transport protein ExoP